MLAIKWLKILRSVITNFAKTFIEAIAIQIGFMECHISTHTEAGFPLIFQ